MMYSNHRPRAYLRIPLTLIVVWITVSAGLAAGVYVYTVVTDVAPPWFSANMLADMALEMGAIAGWSPAILLTGMYEITRRWSA